MQADSQQIAIFAITISLLLGFAFLTYKIVINLQQRNWKSVFWGSWLLDPSQLNEQGRSYRRFYLLYLVVAAAIGLLLLFQQSQ